MKQRLTAGTLRFRSVIRVPIPSQQTSSASASLRSSRARAIRRAASITEPGDPIGLVGDRAMIGGLAYYANRRVVPLETPEDMRQFVDDGGKAIVVNTRKVDRVGEVTPFEVVSRSRTGRREMLVVTPRQGPSAGAPPARGPPAAPPIEER